ncbi:hypothetical protein UVI_02021950 [Ustilaginoidea virens]|uniref:Mediator of RNA polymerase II transcription subunit 5 n=1 Tax=Ustilaginoidea virens TaxID=1159556 RepID=A0A1B5L0V7_USTVR|nr:hypothetical protein UVI_02021950 [Ustilaginoidea virens]
MNQGIDARRAFLDSLLYWSNFVARCIAQRLDSQRFHDFVPLVHARHPLPAAVVAQLFLHPQPDNDVSLDPRIPPYIQVLSHLGYIDAPSLLRALYKFSSLHAHIKKSPSPSPSPSQHDPGREPGQDDGRGKEPRRWRGSSWAEEVMFYHVIKTMVEGTALRDSRSALELCQAIAKWMELFTLASNALAADALHNSQAFHDMDVARAAFIPLLLRLVETPVFVQAISRPFARGGFRKHLSNSLSGFMQTLQHAPFVDRLEIFRSDTLAKLDPVDKKKQAAANAAMDELLETTMGVDNFVIPDLPISNTRAALYVFLNASGQTQSGFIDLILASFDVLANAVFRNEASKDAHVLKSFLINKVPLLLCQLAAAHFDTNSSEFCITEALNQVDTSIFPTASLMFDETRNNNPYTESVREEFCTSCALHGLVQREHVERILGETSMSYEPSLEKYAKDKLVQDCLADADKIQGLIRDVEKTDGNAGAVAQALVDLLDNWQYEEDQGEYQPIYEEFGSILLLVLAFAYRYNLTAADIGISSPDSTVARILTRAHVSRERDELTDQEKGHVSGWIHGLFDSDSGGLGDDLMSSCPPQDFYLLVASIFQNIVVAYTYGYLSDDALKGGVEYLVDTFLLPSLVPALRFLTDYLWVEQREQTAVIKILQLILLPSSISGEASTMLFSVRSLVAKPLEHSLRTYQRQDPKNQDIEPLLRALKDSLPQSRRTGGADHHELESWASSSSSGLSGALRHTIQGLVQWAMHPTANSMPTSYTHRQLMAAVRIMGAKRTLGVLLEETRIQSEAGSASVVFDVVGAMVCSPNVTNEGGGPPTTSQMLDSSGSVTWSAQRALTLRQVLRSCAQRAGKMQEDDAVLAEIVIRLHRRVEGHMAVALPQPQAILEAPGMQLDLTGGGDPGLNPGLGDVDAMAAAGGVGGDGLAVDAVGLDATSERDLFGGLDTSMDMFGWDGMDLTGS